MSTKPHFKDAHLFPLGLLFFFHDLQPPAGFAAPHDPGQHIAPALLTKDEDSLSPGTCTPGGRPTNPANPSPDQQKTLGMGKTSKSSGSCVGIPQPLAGFSPGLVQSVAIGLVASVARRDKLDCTGCPSSLRIKKSQSNIDN